MEYLYPTCRLHSDAGQEFDIDAVGSDGDAAAVANCKQRFGRNQNEANFPDQLASLGTKQHLVVIIQVNDAGQCGCETFIIKHFSA